ncbi:hypothetical protein QY97_02248 [Bacillus thermotolerans]|nr:hypothetical protein QY97_02248 [Bacillus thermotolerans]
MEATHVQLSYSAKRVKEGMSLSRVIPFIKKYKGKQGITSIKVVGEQAGAEKNVYVNKYSEKYPIILKTDENNMLDKEDVYKKIQAVGKSRESLRG